MVVVEHVSLGPLAFLPLYVIGLRYKQQKKLDEVHTRCLFELLACDICDVKENSSNITQIYELFETYRPSKYLPSCIDLQERWCQG